MTYHQARYWRNDKAVWLNTVRYSPDDARVLKDLGLLLRKEGNVRQADQYLARARRIRPDL